MAHRMHARRPCDVRAANRHKAKSKACRNETAEQKLLVSMLPNVSAGDVAVMHSSV